MASFAADSKVAAEGSFSFAGGLEAPATCVGWVVWVVWDGVDILCRRKGIRITFCDDEKLDAISVFIGV